MRETVQLKAKNFHTPLPPISVESAKGEEQSGQDKPAFEGESAKRRGLVAGVESSTGDPTLTGSKSFKDTGDPLADALFDIRRGVTVDEASIRYGIPIDRLERLSGKKAAQLEENDMFAPKSPSSESPEETLAPKRSDAEQAALDRIKKLVSLGDKDDAGYLSSKKIEDPATWNDFKLVGRMYLRQGEAIFREQMKRLGLSLKHVEKLLNEIRPTEEKKAEKEDGKKEKNSSVVLKTINAGSETEPERLDFPKITKPEMVMANHEIAAPKTAQHSQTHWIFVWIGYASFLISCIVTPQRYQRRVEWELLDYSFLSYETLLIEWTIIAVLTGVPALYFHKRNLRKQ